MARNGQKRPRHEFEEDNRLGVGQTLLHMQAAQEATKELEAHDVDGERHVSSNGHDRDDNAGEWQRVHRKRSRRGRKVANKEGDTYPSISPSSQFRPQSFVKLSELQDLVLYVLADGIAPRWTAVRNHANVRKVVALMVPGLEGGMFDGRIPVSDPQQQESNHQSEAKSAPADSPNPSQKAGSALKSQDTSKDSRSQPVRSHKLPISPDEYYPMKLKPHRLPVTLQPLSDIFEHMWSIKTPGDSKYCKMHSPLAAMLISPIVKTKEEKNAKGPQPPTESKTWKNQRTPITEFVASTEELVEEGYVLHPAHCTDASIGLNETVKREQNKTTVSHGWVDAPNISTLAAGEVADRDIESGSILAGRTIVAMDCEMCVTSPRGTTPQVFSLTRISLIDWNGDIVLDELVKPEQPITDYLTPYSGITAAMLEHTTTSLKDIQTKLVNDILTPQTIIIGHSLESDFKALQLTHPFVIDTALIFPHPRGPPLKSSLKWLAQKYLSREIQKGHGTVGHDSIEDARACLDLVKQKCEKGKAWGTSEASGESIFKRLGSQIRPKRDKANAIGDDEPRSGAVVDWGEPARGYGAHAKVAIGCDNDEQVVAGVKRAIEGDDDDSVVPKGGVDFIFGRLRELEAYRGWWNRSKNLDGETLRKNTTSGSESESLSSVTAKTIAQVQDIWECLPPCTAFIVFSGSGDPRELVEMQTLQQRFKDEYKVKKWDELSVKWTDVEEQNLRKACEKARLGVAFVTVK